MNLNKLRTFVHVVECGSITLAARNLYRTQPAISSALKDLENETGLILFERRNAKVFTTPQGQELYEFCHSRIQEIDDKAQRLQNNLEVLSGTIRLGILQDYSESLGPDIIAGFRKQFPQVRFQLFSQSLESMEASLLECELDIGLMVFFEQREMFEIIAFKRFSREPMASSSYLKSVDPVLEYSDMLSLDLLSLGERLGSFRHWFRKNGLRHAEVHLDKINPVSTANSMSDFNQLVINGLGVGMCSPTLLQSEINKQQLIRLFPDANPLYITMDIARRKTRSPSLLLDTFWDYLKERRHV